ncbi:MAG: hypothetical protein AAGJ80_10705 [Cyanobacteria bacterium J06553_1]
MICNFLEHQSLSPFLLSLYSLRMLMLIGRYRTYTAFWKAVKKAGITFVRSPRWPASTLR